MYNRISTPAWEVMGQTTDNSKSDSYLNIEKVGPGPTLLLWQL